MHGGEGGTAPFKEMVKKRRASGMTWTGLWIEKEMGIDYACWETLMYGLEIR